MPKQKKNKLTDNKTHRAWFFTINNPDNNEIPNTWANINYCVWQREKGAEGTEHLQGSVCFKNPVRFSGMKHIHSTAHWEPIRSEEAANAYCMKEETRIDGPWTIGIVPTKRGQRVDLLKAKAAIDSGQSLVEVYRENFEASSKYFRFFKEYARVTTPKREWKTEVVVFIGPTGTGKTLAAQSLLPTAYWLPQGKWWDDYDRHDDVIIDEYYGWLPYSYLLRLLDRYPLLVETKGGQVQFVARRIIITSNKHPSQWYKTDCAYEPLARRFTAIQVKAEQDEEFEDYDEEKHKHLFPDPPLKNFNISHVRE